MSTVKYKEIVKYSSCEPLDMILMSFCGYKLQNCLCFTNLT